MRNTSLASGPLLKFTIQIKNEIRDDNCSNETETFTTRMLK